MISILLTCLMTFAADPPTPAPQLNSMLCTQPVWDVAIEDINNDGRQDLCAICCDDKADPLTKELVIFFATPEYGYPAEPSVTMPLPEEIGCAWISETDGASPREIVTAHAEGCTIFRFTNGGMAEVARKSFFTLLPTGAKHPSFLTKVCADLDGDGRDEWMLPVPGGYEIRTQNDTASRVNCEVVSKMEGGDSPWIYHRLPVSEPCDLPDDATRKGVVFLGDSRADFIRPSETGKWSAQSRFRIPAQLDQKWDTTGALADINKDGFPDIIVSQIQGTLSVRAVTHVYIATGPGAYPEKPSATFDVAGAVSLPTAEDVNNDGYKDLVFIGVPFGLKTFVNYFMFKQVSVQISVFRFDGKAYPAKPDLRTEISVDAPEGKEPPIYTGGDFNGDGLTDAAIGSGKDKVAFYASTTTQIMAGKPWSTVSIPALGLARDKDLNGNPAKDLVVFHPGGNNCRKIEAVVF